MPRVLEYDSWTIGKRGRAGGDRDPFRIALRVGMDLPIQPPELPTAKTMRRFRDV